MLNEFDFPKKKKIKEPDKKGAVKKLLTAAATQWTHEMT